MSWAAIPVAESEASRSLTRANVRSYTNDHDSAPSPPPSRTPLPSRTTLLRISEPSRSQPRARARCAADGVKGTTSIIHGDKRSLATLVRDSSHPYPSGWPSSSPVRGLMLRQRPLVLFGPGAPPSPFASRVVNWDGGMSN